VLNTDEEFKIALDLGVDGIITDFPSKLIDFLNKNPAYKRSIVARN
jgi:glycerophosphoryl diester phosphodiesterase